MPSISTTTLSIQELIEKVLNGDIQVPYLQRRFEWRDKDIAKFFNSILAELPIGVPVFVKYDPSLGISSQLLEGAKEWWTYHYGSVPPAVMSKTPSYLVIDGLQRLTSLILALLPFTPPPGSKLPSDIFYEVDIHSSPPHIKKKHRKTKPRSPIVCLDDFYGVYSPTSSPSPTPPIRVVHKSSPHAMISTSLHTYKVTILQYETKSLQEMIFTFQNINKAGVVLSLFALAAAQVSPHVDSVVKAKSHPLISSAYFRGSNLHEWLDSLDKHLRSTVFSSKSRRTSKNRVYLKGTAGENAVLRSLSMIMDLYLSKPIKIHVPDDSHILSKLKSALTASSSVPASSGPTPASVPYRALDFAWIWNYTCISIQEAWKYLYNHFGVVDPKIIPYMTILPPLAVMLHYSSIFLLTPSAGVTPDDYIKCWYWSSVFLGRYSKGTNKIMARDVQDFIDYFTSGGATTPEWCSELRSKWGSLGLGEEKSNVLLKAILGLIISRSAGGATSSGSRPPTRVTSQAIVPLYVLGNKDLHKHPLNMVPAFTTRSKSQVPCDHILTGSHPISLPDLFIGGSSHPPHIALDKLCKAYASGASPSTIESLYQNFLEERGKDIKNYLTTRIFHRCKCI